MKLFYFKMIRLFVKRETRIAQAIKLSYSLPTTWKCPPIYPINITNYTSLTKFQYKLNFDTTDK